VKPGWRISSIGDVCDVVNGGTPKTGVADYWGGPHQWVTPAEMGKRENPHIAETQRSLTDFGLADSSARVVPPHSVILSSRAPIGHLVINTVPMSTNQGCKSLVPSKALDHRFLYYYLFGSVDLLNELGTGATFKELSGGKLKEVSIPIPPLPEQKCIVAILDEAFAGIDTAISNTAKNIENAREMAASSLSLILVHEAGARDIALEDAVTADCTLSYGIVQPGDDVPDGMPIVRPTDLGAQVIGLDGLKRIDPSLAAGYKRTTLKGGDLLLCVRGSTGVLSQAAAELAGANVTRGIVPIRFNPSVLKQDLGYFLLRSADVQKAIREGTYGAALMQINIRDVRKITLRIPRSDRQDGLLAKMQEVVANGENLLNVYQRKLASLLALKQSILHRAFAGDLTATPNRMIEAAE